MTSWSTNAERSRSMLRRRSAMTSSWPRALSRRASYWAEGVAQVAAAQPAELGLGGHDGHVELGRRRLSSASSLRASALAAVVSPRRALERGQLAAHHVDLQRPQLGHQVAVAAGGVGLLLERAELAAHLAHQVAQAQQVALGGGQPALGPLLALAVLEDAGRLLDDEAPLLGPGVEHGVDLALADDDVLLAADAGVAEQVLHVEQAAGHAVDGVLALARAEQRAGDGDLAELDRHDPGGVVDGERHLGPAQRRALVGAGEDDVVHLLAAHAPRAPGRRAPSRWRRRRWTCRTRWARRRP